MPVSSTLPPALIELANEYFNQHYTIHQPLEILVIVENFSDGIGDFIHALDICNLLKEKFKTQQNVRIHGICFIDPDKLIVVRSIYGEALSKHPIHFCKRKHFDDYGGLILRADVVINLSLKIETAKTIVKYLWHFTHPAMVFSILEYGQTSTSTVTTLNYGKDCYYVRQISMGVLSHQAGIKINKTLAEYSHAGKDASRLHKLQNKPLLNMMLHGGKTASAYLSQTAIGCGYLQRKFKTHHFILMTVSVASSKSVDIFIDHQFVTDPAQSSLQLPASFLKQLETLQIDQIELISNTGIIQHCVRLTDKIPVRLLRLIHFTGTTEEDKKIFLSLSECVACSGDTSFSEMVSSGQFPFFDFPVHKNLFLNQLRVDIKNRYPHAKELIAYFREIHAMGETPGSLIFVQQHYAQILLQWQVYCRYLIANCNIQAYLDHLMNSIAIQMIRRNQEPEKIEKLSPFLPLLREAQEKSERLYRLMASVESYAHHDELEHILQQWPKEESIPIVMLVVNCIYQETQSAAKLALSKIVKTTAFACHIDEILPYLLEAFNDYHYLLKRALSEECSLLMAFAHAKGREDDNELKDFVFKKIAIIKAKKFNHPLFAEQMVNVQKAKLLGKIALLALVAVYINRVDILFTSDEWQEATTSPSKTIKYFINDLEEIVRRKCATHVPTLG